MWRDDGRWPWRDPKQKGQPSRDEDDDCTDDPDSQPPFLSARLGHRRMTGDFSGSAVGRRGMGAKDVASPAEPGLSAEADMKLAKDQIQPPSKEMVSVAAYYLWQEAGLPAGRDQEFWLAAESKLAQAGNGTKARVSQPVCDRCLGESGENLTVAPSNHEPVPKHWRMQHNSRRGGGGRSLGTHNSGRGL